MSIQKDSWSNPDTGISFLDEINSLPPVDYSPIIENYVSNLNRKVTMRENIEMWINAINEKANEVNGIHWLGGRHIKYILERGRKYTKVVREENNDGKIAKSVHAFFVNDNGDILKAASWSSPAKGVRFNVVNDITALLEECDPYGSYLYKR